MRSKVQGPGSKVLLVALAVLLSAVAFAQEKPAAPAKVAGTWQTTLEMEVGTASIVLTFAQEAEKLTGTYAGRYGKYPLVGTVIGNKLDFVVTINAEGTETKMHFIGELDAAGSVIKGSADLGGMGEAGWVAKPAK
jgi:hypothetical protein